ncbi:hypothetical protein [Kitasatospora sp. NPDC087315]|uniref:hypothetical protein n=1 Tax=Kitasatospora sp. NPDC087315 TaxID=3364069 RepID=UPI0038024213
MTELYTDFEIDPAELNEMRARVTALRAANDALQAELAELKERVLRLLAPTV